MFSVLTIETATFQILRTQEFYEQVKFSQDINILNGVKLNISSDRLNNRH